MNDFIEISPHEMVYLYTIRTREGLIRRMIWHEQGQVHRANFDEFHAAQMGLDILEGTRLCAPWAMVYSIVEMALFESMGI